VPVADSARSPAVRRRLLIVDDVAANRMLLRAVLELAGHDVVETTDGREALTALERGSFDAMITDALMPNMDGFRLCLELRKQPRFGRLPIIIYTSTYDSPTDRALAERVGADRYLVKPASRERILATIQDAIREASGRPLRPPPPPIEEVALVREYNVALITKLEQRNDELTSALEALRRIEEQFRALVEISAQIVWTTGPDGMAIADSPSWRAFTGQSFEEGRGSGWLDAIHPDDRAGVVRRWQQLVASGSPAQFEYRLRHVSGGWRWTQVRAVCLKHADGTPREWVGMNMDIEEQKKAEALLAGQRQILELISTGTPLERTLDALIRLIEGQSPGTLGAVLLLDADAGQLRCCAAPTLPAGYVAELERIPIRAAGGSSGTAAFRLQPVVVSDIAADPLWDDDRESALRHGLRACWATPILNSRQRLLGIFALYYREPGAPPAADAPLVEVATHLAAIAISRHQTETKNREQLDELRRWQDVMLEREGRIQELKAEVNDLLARRGEPLRYADPGPLPS
jgi:PAS domain S-box-containing protein